MHVAKILPAYNPDTNHMKCAGVNGIVDSPNIKDFKKIFSVSAIKLLTNCKQNQNQHFINRTE